MVHQVSPKLPARSMGMKMTCANVPKRMWRHSTFTLSESLIKILSIGTLTHVTYKVYFDLQYIIRI